MNRIVKIITLTALLSILLFGACARTDGKSSTDTTAVTNFQFYSISEGLKKAKELDRPIMIDFFTSWCKWCKVLDEKVYAHPDIKSYLANNFVSIKINGEGRTQHNIQITHKDDGTIIINKSNSKSSESVLAQTMGVRSYPTIVFFTSDGKIIAGLEGFRPADEFIHIVRYIGSSAYTSMTFEEYMKSEQK